MSTRVRVRFGVILCVVLLSTLPIYAFGIRLGLDLRGGVLLVLQVVTDDAVRAETDQTLESLQSELRSRNIAFREVGRTQNDEIAVGGLESEGEGEFRTLVNDTLTDWKISQSAPGAYILKMNPQHAQITRRQSVQQAIHTIRNRVDQAGIAEATVQKYEGPGEDRVLVQFPGVEDPDRVKNLIQATAFLEIKLLEDPVAHQSVEAALDHYGGTLPSRFEVLRTIGSTPEYYVVHRVAAITGRSLKTASVSRDWNGNPAVSFSLNADGARQFERFTAENIGNWLAVVLDGRIQSVARVDEKIADSGIIVGGARGFARERARDLAVVLRSGALPASLTYQRTQMVGPSLGADSIRAGITAALVAAGLVVASVLVYYGRAGVNAAAAMVLNVILLLGAIAVLGSTLTLPGIAGVILTIGVGIDSNVLVFERIREELRAGKPAASAVDAGFNRVFVTLMDTHLAALIAATFLFLFGTGPVQGFAVTLIIGVLSNLFTSVFVSRTLFEWVLQSGRSAF